MPGPQKGNPYGRRHNENVVPMVVAHEQGGYGIATWDEQSTEEQCDWIKRYLYENLGCCLTQSQKASRKVKVTRWTGRHKKDALAPANLRAVEIYYDHYQLKHSLTERDKENAELRKRLDINEKVMDENRELKAENERLKKDIQDTERFDSQLKEFLSKTLVEKDELKKANGKLREAFNKIKGVFKDVGE